MTLEISIDELDPGGKFCRGLPEKADLEDQKLYAEYRLKVYCLRKDAWKGELLKEYFKEDFESFTQEMFRNLPLDTRRDLRSVLRGGGVFVQMYGGISMPAALFKTLTEDLDWPDGERPTCIPSESFAQGPVPLNTVLIGKNSPRNVCTSENVPNMRNSTYGISSMMKAYTYGSDKFSGALSDNFERKLKLFNERSEQCNISEADKPKEFSLMLTGVALEYYFTHVKNIITDFDGIVSKINERFVTEERTLAMTQE